MRVEGRGSRVTSRGLKNYSQFFERRQMKISYKLVLTRVSSACFCCTFVNSYVSDRVMSDHVAATLNLILNTDSRNPMVFLCIVSLAYGKVRQEKALDFRGWRIKWRAHS